MGTVTYRKVDVDSDSTAPACRRRTQSGSPQADRSERGPWRQRPARSSRTGSGLGPNGRTPQMWA
jgi:hypothetical protein